MHAPFQDLRISYEIADPLRIKRFYGEMNFKKEKFQ